MGQHDARRDLIDILPARPAGSDELLVEVVFADAEGPHPLLQDFCLFWMDRIHISKQCFTFSAQRKAIVRLIDRQ